MTRKHGGTLKQTPGSAIGVIYRRAKGRALKSSGHWDVDRQYFVAVMRDVFEKHAVRATALAKADDFNFVHDVFGIMRHYNERTHRLDNYFVPRFATR